MNKNSSDSPLLVTMLKNFIEPAIYFLDADFKDPIVKAIGLMTAAGVELDQMKDAPEETIKSFFDSWTSQSNAKYLTKLLRQCDCYHEAVLLVDPKLLTREFLALRDSIDEDKMGAVLKSAMDSMDIKNLRVLLSDESENCGVETRRRFFTIKVLEKIKYLYPNLYFPELFGLDIESDAFSFNDVFPLEILEKPYLLVLSQYGKCTATQFEKNLLRKLLSEEHRDVIEQLYDKQIDIRHDENGSYMIKLAITTSLESNIEFKLDNDANFECRHSVTSLTGTCNDKIFGMLLRAIRADVYDKYDFFFYFSDDFPESRVKIVVAQLALDTIKGLTLDRMVYDDIKLTRYENYHKKCQKQVKWMKRVVIFKTVTLLDALDCDIEDLAQFLGLKDNIQIILAQCQEKKLIDYYYSLLEEQLYTAIAVQATRARAAKFIQRATGLFAIVVIDKIMSYLSLKDLRFFALPVDPKI